MAKDAKSINIVDSEKVRKDKWLNEEVTFEFMNLEEPGMIQKFSYGTTRKPEVHTLFHGGKYTKPRHLVNHIESRRTPIWNYRPNGIGGSQKELTGYKSRFQCRVVFE